MKPRTAITAVVLMLCFALMFLNFGNQVSGYATFEEAGYERSHVVGTWAKKDLTAYRIG